ncbi:acyltransferase [Vagococcus zengguangii]|uniref:Acyltransferase n=1 Tax=Vagococcus zengguangii TaxID=2571750 RepID=A0A4D7CS17_9ENTE|nr:acyltransferase [Vagococcus zengguangii]QCI87015.1 acyltransferase [Vagococcus zengguangii]
MYRLIYFIDRSITFLFKILNYRYFGKKTKLFGIPKLIHHKNIKFGNHVRINENIYINASGGVNVGNNVTLSRGVSIYSTGYSLVDWEKNKYKKLHIDKEVNIKDNVWVGANSLILAGVTIEEGIVVAAGSIVNKSLMSPNSLYAGCPARKIKEL